MTEAELEAEFEKFGSVKSVKIIKDRDTNRSKGFAFVDMNDQSAGSEAIEALNGKEIGGRTLRINEAKPRQ